MSLPVRATLDEAYIHAARVAVQYGYSVARSSTHAIDVWDELDTINLGLPTMGKPAMWSMLRQYDKQSVYGGQ